MAVTRIKNNQISDATITAAKIASQTLVGSLFATDLTLNSNLNVIGNLTVTGTSSNINAINTYISDPFVIFNNGYTGSITDYTIGILVNRNLSSLNSFGAVNTAWVWSEADAAFTGIATTDTGTGIVSINNSGYANIKIGNLNAVTAINASSITATTLNFTNAFATTLVATNFSTGNAVISGGYISALANATITTGNTQSWYATTFNSTTGNITTLTATTINAGTTTSAVLNSTTGNITTLDAGTTTTANLNSTTGNITTLGAGTTTTATLNATTGNITTLGAGTTTSAVLNSTTGNITTLDVGTTTTAVLNSTTGNITTLDVGTTTTAVLNSTTANITTGNAQIWYATTLNTTTANITNGNSTTFVATNLSSGNAVITGGSVNNSPIGNGTPSTGAFTTLTASGATTFTSSTQSDNATTGAVVVTGGVGIGANLNVAGNVTVTGNLLVLGNTTTLNTETLNVEDLNITVAANATTGAEANGAGLTVAGANATFTYLNADDSWNLNKKLNATTVNAALINITTANITTGNTQIWYATTLNATDANITTGNTQIWYATTLNATDANITTGNTQIWYATTVNSTTGNITNVNSSTLVATNFSSGNAVITGGSINNSPIGNATPNTGSFTTLATSGVYVANGNIVANSGVNATNYTTGALVVPGGGGVGITGDLWVQGPSTFQGNIAAGNIILSGNINVSVGAVQSSFGVFYGNAGGIGALYAGTSTFTALPTTVLQLTANVDTYAQVNFQNLNSGTEASTDFVMTADNGTDTDGFLDLGINSSTYNDPTYPGFYPNDGYLVHHTAVGSGNLIIFSHQDGSAIKLHVGEYGASNVRATVTNTGFRVNTATASTTSTSGALVVDGGTGIAGNLNVGLGAAFNTTKTANYDFVVKGVSDNTLFWARPSNTYDQIVIGNSATSSTLVIGAKLIVNTSDSILLPVGTTGQRPGSIGGTDTAGMIRFNTSLNDLEYFNGTTWQQPSINFTVITSQQFTASTGNPNGNVDGINSTFTLSNSGTTNGAVVTINGILQAPTSAYSITGSTLSFTEAPAIGDMVDVRQLTTTTEVKGIAGPTGFYSVNATNSNVYITTGSTSANITTSWINNGAEVNSNPNVTIATSGLATNIDMWSTSVYSSSEYTATATIENTNIRQMCKVMVVTDGTGTVINQSSNIVTSGNSLIAFGALVVDGNLYLQGTTTNNNTIVRLKKIYQLI